jgi:hypothetical protein
MKAGAKPTAGAADQRFAEVVAAFAADRRLAPVAKALRAEQESGRPKKFGAGALKVKGKMFAMVSRGQLVVKLARDRASALVTSGEGKYFDPGHGRLMKQWIVIVNDQRSWLELAKEAHDFVERSES